MTYFFLSLSSNRSELEEAFTFAEILFLFGVLDVGDLVFLQDLLSLV